MNKEIIKLSKISKKFVGANKDIIVLKNVNLKINKGELISLSGPSGSGKSTLLHIMALLDRPTSGEVFFKKKSFTKSNDSEKDLVRRRGISIIYQQNNLLNDFTALENVLIPLVNNGYSWTESGPGYSRFCQCMRHSRGQSVQMPSIWLARAWSQMSGRFCPICRLSQTCFLRRCAVSISSRLGTNPTHRQSARGSFSAATNCLES